VHHPGQFGNLMSEATKINVYYSNATLILATPKVVHSATELLFKDDAIIPGYPLLVDNKGGEQYQIYARQRTKRPRNNVSLPKQEKYLSPRVLHFMPGELAWECRESFACQCSNEGKPDPLELLAITQACHRLSWIEDSNELFVRFVWGVKKVMQWTLLSDTFAGLLEHD